MIISKRRNTYKYRPGRQKQEKAQYKKERAIQELRRRRMNKGRCEKLYNNMSWTSEKIYARNISPPGDKYKTQRSLKDKCRRELLPQHQQKKETRATTGTSTKKGKKEHAEDTSKKPPRNRHREGRSSRRKQRKQKIWKPPKIWAIVWKCSMGHTEQNRRRVLCNNPERLRELRSKAYSRKLETAHSRNNFIWIDTEFPEPPRLMRKYRIATPRRNLSHEKY